MKFIRIFLLVLIVVGIGLLFTQKFWVQKLTDKILSYQKPTLTVSQEDILTPTIPKVLPVKDSTNCDTISNSNDQYGCYSKQAVTKNDLTVCNKIESQDFKNRCYIDFAQLKKNPQVCSEIKDQKYKSDCYNYMAALLNDEKWCDKVVGDDLLKGGCKMPFQLREALKPAITVTMDLSMATLTGKPGQTVDVVGTIENYSGGQVYLNSMGGSLGSENLEFDMTNFFKVVPRIVKPSEIYKGPLFSISIGNNIAPGNYFVSFYFIGGESDMDSKELIKQNLSITVQ